LDKRRRIGIIYRYDENWIGGTYYIQNLIAALKELPKHEMFELVIFTENDSQYFDLRNITQYPFMTQGSYVKRLSLAQRVINRISRVVSNRNLFSVYNSDIDLIFPADNIKWFKKNQSFLYWIPDFQDHYLPEFFSAEEIERRRMTREAIIKNGTNIAFSSKAARKDFNQIYPGNTLHQYTLNFAVTHPVLNNTSSLKEKYSLPDTFFICCNQFWKHKNHITILKAIAFLSNQGSKIFVAFTGKEHDDRHPDFFKRLLETANDFGVRNNVAFLGFISRQDQLCLMKEAVAVIQPSLFEGWSTVIEDAKALKIKILASDIDVHKEQLAEYNLSALFSPLDEIELANKILKSGEMSGGAPAYKKNVLAFAEKFKMIFDSILNN
jgi:glycosyltransferase involved in cell wall biosynthesis